MTKAPNFLFFMTDQHRSDWLGCMGHPVVKTPNIDAIAAQGRIFDDFHAASPICMPNRASLMTGRMPSVHGLRANGCLLDFSQNTFVDVLAKAGYDTALIGKSHLQPFTTDDPIRAEDGKTRLIEEATSVLQGDYGQEAPERYTGDTRYEFKTPYYGFNHVDMVTSHGVACGGHYRQWLRAKRSDWEDLLALENELPHDYTVTQANRTPMPEELYPTTYIADRAIDYLSDDARAENPFFAFVSFPDPHHPFNPPGKYWDMYAPEDFSLDLPYEAHENPTPSMEWLKDQYLQGGAGFTPQSARHVSDRHAQEAMALTAGMITMIDDQIGRVIEALKTSGEYENTVIIFTSDHGDYLGDFSMLLKGALPFRSITQVPMIWSDPRDRAAKRLEGLASTIDISASILDRVGLTPYFGMQGQSFLPMIFEGAGHRDEILIEYNDGMARMGFESPARMRALRSKDWRFTLYRDQDWGELYDLRQDPSETRNLWASPEHQGIRGELALRLSHHLAAQMDDSPRATRLA